MSTNIPVNTDGGLLTADNSAVVSIDHQPQMTFGVAKVDRQLLVDNLVLPARCVAGCAGGGIFGVAHAGAMPMTETFHQRIVMFGNRILCTSD